MFRLILTGFALAVSIWLLVTLLVSTKPSQPSLQSGHVVQGTSSTTRRSAPPHTTPRTASGRLSAPPSITTPSQDLIEIVPFPSPTRENFHESIARMDEVWTILQDTTSEERHRLTFYELVPVLGVPGTRLVLLQINSDVELRRLEAWVELNPEHPNSQFGPYSHLLDLNPDPVWYDLFVPSQSTFEMLSNVVNDGFNESLANEPTPYFPSGPPQSLRNVPLFHLPNPFLDLPSSLE